MLEVDDQVRQALAGTHVGTVRAVASYQGEEVELNLARGGSLNFRSSGTIQAAGSVKAFGYGDTLVPRWKTDMLATYGQEITLWRGIDIRGAQWEIPLGVYRIRRAGNWHERLRRGVVLDWSVELDLADRFRVIERAKFLGVDYPRPGNLVWDEIRRLSPIPVQEALGNATVPRGTVYEDPLQAIETLIALLGGEPHMTRSGALTARQKDAWLTSTTPVFDIRGTISWSDEMTDEFYNQVRASNPSQESIVAWAVIDDDSNPLSVNRAGPSTYTHASPIYETKAQVRQGAETILARLSTQRSRTVTVTCTPEALLLELGDFGWVRDAVAHRAVLGEVTGITVPTDPTAPVQLELIVGEALDYWQPPEEIPVPLSLYPASNLYPSAALFPG